MASKNRIAVYLRVSTAEQDFRSQKQAVLDYCARRQWKNPSIYQEKVSGSKVRRTELDRLMQDARAGKVDTVVVFKMDRIGRSLPHYIQVVKELEALKVGVIATSQGIDTSQDNPTGRLHMHFLGVIAEFEGDTIRDRTMAGLASARRRGRKLGRPPISEEKKALVRSLRAQLNKKKRPMPIPLIVKSTGLSLGAVCKILKEKA